MFESWETWLNHAARKSWPLRPSSENTWIHLDPRIFGNREDPNQQRSTNCIRPNTIRLGRRTRLKHENVTRQKHIIEYNLWKSRVHLLSDQKRNAMERFVERLKEGKERILSDNWDDEAVRGEGLHQVGTEILVDEQRDLSAGIQGMKFRIKFMFFDYSRGRRGVCSFIPSKTSGFQ
jgi:hypothetical protein